MNKCTTILAHVEEKHWACWDVISRARGLHHARTYSAATQKRCGWFMLCQLATMYVQIHCIRFSLYVCCRYVAITIKAACSSSKHDDQNDNYKWTHWHSSIFTRQNFPNPDSSIFSTVKILRHTVCSKMS